MIYLEVLAIIVLIWMFWQLYRAKQFTKFKTYLNNEIKNKVTEALKIELENSRSELTPNNETHIEAALLYWTQSPVRILQYALNRELITIETLKKEKKWRYCQHLFHVQKQFLNPTIPIEPTKQ